MSTKVGIVIPCYKAKGLVNKVVDSILYVYSQMEENFSFLIYVVDDCCPEKSYEEIKNNKIIKVLKHEQNLGVGAATITGFRKAKEDNCKIFIKLDADCQHNPIYLLDLIQYIYQLPPYDLVLIKGTRYFSPYVTRNIPFIRKLGSLFLEPIARAAISYRKLTDITNGYIAFNLSTLENILSPNLGISLESRYLFESSLLAKCCELDCEIHEFPMASRYSKNNKSSLKSYQMILPLLNFWIKTILKRILNKYLFSLNLGSILLLISGLSFFLHNTIIFQRDI